MLHRSKHGFVPQSWTRLTVKTLLVCFLIASRSCVESFSFASTFSFTTTTPRPQLSRRSHSSLQAKTGMQGPAIQPPRPNSCTYWVSSRVLAGEHPTDRRGIETTKRKLRQYLKLGVTVFIDLTEPGQKMDYQDLLQELAMEIPESDPANSLEYYRLSVPDFDIPTVEGMQQNIGYHGCSRRP